jgi:hypothetical protein
VLVELVDQTEHGLTLALEVGLVDRAVPGRQRHLEHLLLLRWQVGGHQLLGAAQEERTDPLAEPVQHVPVAEPLHRDGDVLDEPLWPRVEPRRDDGQQ